MKSAYTKKQQLVAGTYLQMRKELGKWPTQIEVAHRLQISRGSVSNIIMRLKELGVIKYSSRKTIESISDICEQELSKPKDDGLGINWLSVAFV